VIREGLEPHQTTIRPRREVSPITLRLLWPFFRRCREHDAWILRAVGQYRGPVLVKRVEPNLQDAAEGGWGLSLQPRRFARGSQRAGQLGEDRYVDVTDPLDSSDPELQGGSRED
jgi:hypothetical protein